MKEVLKEAQSLAVKRAEVEFRNFASLGEPERAIAHYAEQNTRRAAAIRQHEAFIGEMTPFLEFGSNVGHSSYMLGNEFSASGFALDLSADSLRYGATLRDRWHLSRAPLRIAGDALNLPFADGSASASDGVSDAQPVHEYRERVSGGDAGARAGGVFLFAEEPLKRLLTLRLYRCPYYDTMKPWERKAHEWGLLGYLVRSHIGAHQEESFGIRQNQSMELKEWHELISRHFAEAEYQIFVPGRGWGERIVSGR